MAGEAKPKPPKFELEVYEEIDMVTKYFRVLYEPNPDYVDVFFSEIHPVDLVRDGRRLDPSRGLYCNRRSSSRLAARVFDYYYSRYEGAKANVLSLYSFACFFVGFNCYYRRYFLRVPLAASRAQARVHCQDCFREEWDVAALMKKFGIRPGINRKQFIEHFGDAPEPVRQYLFAPGEGTATLNLHNVDDGVKMIRRKPKK